MRGDQIKNWSDGDRLGRAVQKNRESDPNDIRIGSRTKRKIGGGVRVSHQVRRFPITTEGDPCSVERFLGNIAAIGTDRDRYSAAINGVRWRVRLSVHGGSLAPFGERDVVRPRDSDVEIIGR